MDGPAMKTVRLRPRHSLCEFEAYQCDRPRYPRSRYCDAHICEMQTLRPTVAAQNDLTVETGVESKPEAVVQCQYRVRRYERRCRNPVPPDAGDVHFCSEHRARVASRETNDAQRDGSLASAILADYKDEELHPGLSMPRSKEERAEWKEDWDSDAESPASDDEEMMESTRNAGAFSLNELLLNAMFHRRKLMLLYQEQMAFLRRLLHHDYAVYEEARRDHRHLRTATNTIIMRGRQAEAFRATRNFKRYSGAESLVHEKAKRLRIRSVCPEKIRPAANPQRCAYNDPTKDEKCPERVLPLAKYCPQHILHQPNQCLFQACRTERCDQPVLRSALAEEKEATSDPEQLCTRHRPEESLIDFLPPDISKATLQEAISALPSLAQPPAEAVNAARSASKARVLRRDDSINLQETFDLNLIMPDMMDMDANLMEEALRNAGNWEELNMMDFLPAHDLLTSELDSLNETLWPNDPGMVDRRKEDEGLVDLRSLNEGREELEKEEDIEVECVAEDMELQELGSSELQAIEQLHSQNSDSSHIQHSSSLNSPHDIRQFHVQSPHPLQQLHVESPHHMQQHHVGSPHTHQHASQAESPQTLVQPHVESSRVLQQLNYEASHDQQPCVGSPHVLQQSHDASSHSLPSSLVDSLPIQQSDILGSTSRAQGSINVEASSELQLQEAIILSYEQQRIDERGFHEISNDQLKKEELKEESDSKPSMQTSVFDHTSISVKSPPSCSSSQEPQTSKLSQCSPEAAGSDVKLEADDHD